MAESARLGGVSQTRQRVQAAPAETPHRGLLAGVLVMLITVSLTVIVYLNRPQTPANIVAGPPTPSASEDSSVFNPEVAEEQQRLRQAAQEKEDSAVFGQAPSDPHYRLPGH